MRTNTFHHLLLHHLHNFVDIVPSSFGPWYPLVSFFHHFSSFFSFAILGSVIVVVVYFFCDKCFVAIKDSSETDLKEDGH